MRVVFTIAVGMDVPTYKEAGKAIDKITDNLKEVLGESGEYDLESFQARHYKIRRHPIEGDAKMARAPEHFDQPMAE